MNRLPVPILTTGPIADLPPGAIGQPGTRLLIGNESLGNGTRSGARFGVNFNHRYGTPFQKARVAIAAGTLGAPAYLLWKFTGGHYPERHGPLGHLLYMQSHGFDMLRWLGGPIAEVSCVASSPRGDGALTSAVVSLRFASGAVGALIASVDANYADTHNHEFEYVGLGGRIRVTDALRSYELSLSQQELFLDGFGRGRGRNQQTASHERQDEPPIRHQ